MNDVKKTKKMICYHCVFRGDTFKLGSLTHTHCQHPNTKGNKDRTYETLKSFHESCANFKQKTE